MTNSKKPARPAAPSTIAFDWCIGSWKGCDCSDCYARTQRLASRKAGR